MPRREAANSLITKQPNMFALRKMRQQNNPIELQILAVKLPAPEKEYMFAQAIGRKWRADLAWPEWRILFEQEGAAFGNAISIGKDAYALRKGQRIPLEAGRVVRLGGRHNQGAGMQADCEKYSYAAILGWMVIRATTTMIRDGQAIQLLEAAFASRRAQGYPKSDVRD